MKINFSILGLYNYNPEIFKELKLPDGMDADVLIPELLSECSDFSLLYPDYPFMQMMIGVWSKKELPIWEALKRSVDVEYNPIENYDRFESVTREVVGHGATTRLDSTQNTSSETVNSRDSRTAFNTLEPTEAGRTDNTAGGTVTSDFSSEAADDSTGKETVESHVHGNIGVTTAPAMLREFREVSNYSVYNYIVESFKRRFCVQVY